MLAELESILAELESADVDVDRLAERVAPRAGVRRVVIGSSEPRRRWSGWWRPSPRTADGTGGRIKRPTGVV